MSMIMSDQARRVMTLAGKEARRLRHDYVGTEHILFGLVEEGAGLGADVLETFGVTSTKMRAEVERLIARGPAAPGPRELPLTPRARQALAFAADEARLVSEPLVGAEHLLLGLVREHEGVAGQVLRNLGLKLEAVREAVLKIRVLQMTIVERAVRPVRATTPRKRKMREELLAHLSAIYDEEQAERNDPAAAVRAAAERFGDPTALARELDRSLSWSERVGYVAERWFAWRAPESVLRYAWRLAANTLVVMVSAFFLTLVVTLASVGWNHDIWTLLQVLAALLAFAPPVVFLWTVGYLRMRDAMWGAFGSRRSLGRVWAWSALLALGGWGFAIALAAAADGDISKPAELWPSIAVAGFAAAACSLLAARYSGPMEIRDAIWALLDVSAANGLNDSEPA